MTLADKVRESQSQVSRKSKVPKGTTEAVMQKLFPTRRSEVPVDEERRDEVWFILNQIGAISEVVE